MSESPIRAEQIEGLEDFLRTIVREEIARTPLTEDVEQLKKMPAGVVIRLEEQIKTIAEDVGEIKSQISNLESRMMAKFDNLESRMATKFDDIESRFDSLESRMATKDDLEELVDKSDSLESRMIAKFDDIESRMATKDDLLQLANKFDNLESRMMTKFDDIESRMATKDQFAQFATKNELNILAQRIEGLINTLDVRIEEQGKRLAFFQTVTYSIFGVLFAMIAGILLKLLFGI